MVSNPFTAEFLSQLETLRLRTRKEFLGSNTGSYSSPRRGTSLEFADYRRYTPGDDLRYIDWGIYARSDRLFVKVFRQEVDLFAYVFVDASASMAFPSREEKFLPASHVALALSYVILANQDHVKLHLMQNGSGKASQFYRGRRRMRDCVNIGQFHPLPPHSSTAVHTSEILEASVIVDSASISRLVQSLQRSRPGRFEGTRRRRRVVPISSCKKSASHNDFSGTSRLYGLRVVAADFELHAGHRVTDRHNAFGQRAAVVKKVLTHQTRLSRPKSDGENAARREVPAEQFEIDSSSPIPFEPDHAHVVEHLPCRHDASKK